MHINLDVYLYLGIIICFISL